jgi:CheY-like chemotaxis protein
MVNVLVVDPQSLVCQLVAEMLEDAGLRVLGAVADAAEALAVFAECGVPAPEVLVVATCRAAGLGGNDLNGRALAAELRQRLSRGDDRAGPPSFGVVHVGEHALAPDGEALGPGEQFLGEPFGRGALVRAVFGVIEREVPRWLAGRRAYPAMRA